MLKFQLFYFILVGTVIGTIRAISEKNKNATLDFILPFVAECCKEMEVPVDDVTVAYDKNELQKLDGCLFACIYKKTKLINDEGNFDLDTATKIVNKLVKGDDLAPSLEINKKCSSVNEKSVTDGSKGCERAKLLIQCYAKNSGFRVI